MDNQALEAKKLEAFVVRLKTFLANDPYWVYLLTLPGGRERRRQVARDIAKLSTTIPKIGDPNEKSNDSDDAVIIVNRSTRRRLTQGKA